MDKNPPAFPLQPPTEHHIPVYQSAMALDVVGDYIEQVDWVLSRRQLKQLFQFGAIWLQQVNKFRRLRRGKTLVAAGDTVLLNYAPEILNAEPLPAELIVDEGDYSVWNKPSGMMVQGTKWGDHQSLLRYAEQHLQPQRIAKIVHRLDRHTSGLILLAHTKAAASGLSNLFQTRQISKIYHAVVENMAEHNELQGDWPHKDNVLTIKAPIDDKPAVSHMTWLREHIKTQPKAHYHLLKVDIETGRKHQIRRHLLQTGFPIVGDKLFGTEQSVSLRLRAMSLQFECPISGRAKHYQLTDNLLDDLLNDLVDEV